MSVPFGGLQAASPLAILAEYLLRPLFCLVSPLLHGLPLRLVLLRLRTIKMVVDHALHHVLRIVRSHDSLYDIVSAPHIHGQFYLLVVPRSILILFLVHHDGALWLSVHPYKRNGRGL